MQERPEDTDVDEWDARIEASGCAKESQVLQDCYIDGGKDWRKCREQVEAFRRCMAKQAEMAGSAASK